MQELKPIVKLMWDNRTRRLDVPPEAGVPAADQLQGCPEDALCEAAGRICYRSLGRGRGSQDYHAHLRETRHWSVYEHAAMTFAVAGTWPPTAFLNRPGLWVSAAPAGRQWRVTLNLRHLMEWERASRGCPMGAAADRLGDLLRGAVIVQGRCWLSLAACGACSPGLEARLVEPEGDRETWATFYLDNVSRTLTHELVRHGDWTGISQESQRYCEVSENPVVWHPALFALRDKIGAERWADLASLMDTVEQVTKNMYAGLVREMEGAGFARKTARGAARGVLPQAIGTGLAFSASIAEWKHIIGLRAAPDADEEIQAVARAVEAELAARGLLGEEAVR